MAAANHDIGSIVMDKPHSKYAGMTIHERLYDAGLFDRWTEAKQNDDREAMIRMLVSVELSPDEAARTVEAIDWNRYFDIQRKTLDAMSISELGELYAKQFGRPADLSIGKANLKELILTDIRLNIPPATQS